MRVGWVGQVKQTIKWLCLTIKPYQNGLQILNSTDCIFDAKQRSCLIKWKYIYIAHFYWFRVVGRIPATQNRKTYKNRITCGWFKETRTEICDRSGIIYHRPQHRLGLALSFGFCLARNTTRIMAGAGADRSTSVDSIVQCPKGTAGVSAEHFRLSNFRLDALLSLFTMILFWSRSLSPENMQYHFWYFVSANVFVKWTDLCMEAFFFLFVSCFRWFICSSIVILLCEKLYCLP